MGKMPNIAFLWSGLPDYAARCIGRYIANNNVHVDVIATRPRVPIEGMESSLGQPVNWLDDPQLPVHWSDLALDIPDMVFASGYAMPAFNSLAMAARKQGAKVILMSDHNWQGSFRQKYLDPIRHRLLINRRFDGLFVPGKSGRRFGERCGFAADTIREGLYGADPAMFNARIPVQDREKKLLFVGQFIDRKNILGLDAAFRRFSVRHPEWVLELCGSGEQWKLVKPHPGIIKHEFVQPAELSAIMAASRCLVLPSLEEHWGLVVHEAASSGCALLTTDNVGAGADLIADENGIQFPAGDENAIFNALCELAKWDEEKWKIAGEYSLAIAATFGPDRFCESVTAFVEEHAPVGD